MGMAGAGARGQEHPGGRARAAVCGQDGAVLVDGSLKAWEVTPFHHRFFSSDCTHGAGAAAAPVPPTMGAAAPRRATALVGLLRGLSIREEVAPAGMLEDALCPEPGLGAWWASPPGPGHLHGDCRHCLTVSLLLLASHSWQRRASVSKQ